MRSIQNSPVHRIRGLLYVDSNGRSQTINRPLEHSHYSPSFSHFGGIPSSAQFVPMASTYGYCTNSLPVYNMGHYPTTDNVFTGGYAFTQSSQSLDTALHPGEVFSGHLDAYQPQMPPAAPEETISLNPAFHYYPCRWMSGPPCDGLAPGRNREMGEHLRAYHLFIGHERDTVQCEWEGCGQVMQRMNVPRHIVSRHLHAAANCRFCGKRFSRPDVVGRHERTCNGSPTSSSPVARV